VEPELAIGLPAAGAVLAAFLRTRPRLALVAGAALGLAGFGAVILSAPGVVSNQLGLTLTLPAGSRALIVAAAAVLTFVVALAPPAVDRPALLIWGLTGMAGLVAIAAAPNLDIVILVVLALAVLHAALPGRRSFAARVRAPVFAATLLAIGLLLARVDGPASLPRFAAVALVAGLAAALGLVPFLHEFSPEEGVAASPVAWMAFLGPVLGLAVMSRARDVIPSAEGAFGALLVGLGLVNVLWGSLASWRTLSPAAAWRYSFAADWGLAWCGFGLALPDGVAAGTLVLYGIVLGRLPLYVWSRTAIREQSTTDRPVNLLVAAALAGSAPFAGFPARVLLLRGATQLYWPLALVLGLAMLLWMPPSLRLGRSMGVPSKRQLAGVAAALGVGVAMGLYPQPFLSLAGL
jgi:hypothetical protein